MCAGVKKNDAAFGGGPKILYHTVEVQTNGVLVVVSVFHDLQARIFEDSVVVCPTRCWYVDLLARRIMTRKEFATNSKSASARDRLGYCDPVIFESVGGRTVGENSRSFGKRRYTGDSRIFLVEC